MWIKFCRDFAELFEGSFEVIGGFLGENVGIGKIVGFFETFVSEPEDDEAQKRPALPLPAALAELSQPEGARIGKVNKNNIHNQKVSTTFGLPPLVHHMPISGDSGWRLRREGEVELF